MEIIANLSIALQPLICDRCGKSMFDESSGTNLTGMSVYVNATPDTTFNEEFVKKQMGKYELDRTYGICFECLLDVLLVRRLGR